jgi:hypothetical protein
MPASAIECLHCGYDFHQADQPEYTPLDRSQFAYSKLADVALVVSAIAAAIVCCVAIVAAVALLIQGEFIAVLVLCPIAFLLHLGQLVVFLRVREFRPDR